VFPYIGLFQVYDMGGNTVLFSPFESYGFGTVSYQTGNLGL
jgi:hypothetical protein